MGKPEPKAKRYRLTAIVLAAVILIVMGALCGQYYHYLQTTVKEESGEYIQEVSKQIATNISKTISDNFAFLETVSMVLRIANATTCEEVQPIIEDQQHHWNFQSILLVDRDGVTYDAYGSNVILNADEYLTDVIVRREKTMTTTAVVGGKDCVLFAAPLSGVTLDGKDMLAILTTYDLATFDRILSLNAFDGQAYCHVIRRDGTVVIRSSSPKAPPTGYNLLSFMQAARMKNGDTVEALENAVAQGESGQVEYVLDGVEKYMAYTPLFSQEWSLLTIVPTSAANQKTHIFMNMTLLLCIVITFLFSLLILFLFLSFYRHERKLEQIAYVDPITGGNTIQRFYDLVQDALARPNHPNYALIYANLQKFKVFNEQFGRGVCDRILYLFHDHIHRALEEGEYLGRIGADNFCLLLRCDDVSALCRRLVGWHEDGCALRNESDPIWPMPTTEFGVYVIKPGDDTPLPIMADRAKLALSESPHALNDRLHYAVYNEEHRRKLFREKYLEDRMESALQAGEFQVYLQPKYRTDNETVGGAEALVRWLSPEDGMIFPDEFIPLFEKNGFVVRLDLWVFEQVCRAIQDWLQAGLAPMKISVNCSRVHLRNPDFLNAYREICTRVGTPPELIEIELTETVVFEDVGGFAQVTNAIHEAGFGCSMDDFGSGYSSLSLLRDIRVDTVKLDKVFFRDFSDMERTEAVVESILQMAARLHMATVAEGVETKEQAQLLRRLGCDLIQGYYYARPMPIADFEKSTFGRQIPHS